eukprot:m51a1_g2051 putative non-ribosomal peptide synthetase (626) ;mRNA; f:1390551-1393197
MRTLHEGFLACARRTPSAPALYVASSRALRRPGVAARPPPSATYESLLQSAELVASALPPARSVGVCCPPGIALVASYLAALSRRSAFVPLELPGARAELLARAARVGAVVAHTSLAACARGLARQQRPSSVPLVVVDDSARVVSTEGVGDGDGQPESEGAAAAAEEEDAAYVMMTSGSTDRPLAVVVPHSCAAPNVRAVADAVGMTDRDVSLSCGGSVVLLPDDVRLSPELVCSAAALFGATFLQATPTFWTTIRRVTEEDLQSDAPVCIGEPIGPGTEIKILADPSSSEHDCVTGELLVGGSRRCHLVGERSEDRNVDGWLRTGDIVSKDVSCVIRYVCRNDRTVKLDGKRVNPREVENAITSLVGVASAWVLPYKCEQGTRLVAAVVRSGGSVPSKRDVAEHMLQALPAFMHPSRALMLESASEVPLLATGKADPQRLAEMADEWQSWLFDHEDPDLNQEATGVSEVAEYRVSAWARESAVSVAAKLERPLALGTAARSRSYGGWVRCLSRPCGSSEACVDEALPPIPPAVAASAPASIRWSTFLRACVDSSALLVDRTDPPSRTVYIGSHDYTVAAIDHATGAQLWRFLTRGRVEGSCTTDESGALLFFGSRDGTAYCVDC